MTLHRQIGVALAAVFAVVTINVFAASALSWQTCVDLAIKNNADLKSAIAAQASVEMLEGGARSGFFPQLFGELDFEHSRVKVNSSNEATSGSSYTASLTAKQNLFSGMQDYAKVRQSFANSDAARATLQIAKSRISYELKSAFENFLYAQNYKNLTKEIIRRREENLRLVDMRFQSGRENKGSVYLSDAYLKQAEYDDLQAQNAKRVSAAQLARAIGIDDPNLLDIQGTIPVVEPESKFPDMLPFAQLTPDYQQAVAQEQSAGFGTTIARASFFPTLNLVAEANQEAPSFFPNDSRAWSITASLTVPIFSGGKDFYNTKSASASWRSAEQQRVNVSRQLIAKLEQAYANYIEAVSKLRVDESFKQAALVRAEISRKRYNNGLLTFEDWDVIENDLILREKNYLQSKRDRVLAEAAWEQAQGKGVIP